MGLYIIGDLHLGFSANKPMDVFGNKWHDHYIKIAADWQARVMVDDWVILAGDTSWATHFNQAKIDFAWLDALPGHKIILKGNHDYWWTTLKKMRGHFRHLHFLHNNAYCVGDYTIVGTRGWEIVEADPALSADAKIYQRECQRLQLSIDQAQNKDNLIAVLHYPPFKEDGSKSQLVSIIEENGIKRVFFGHIHSNYQAVKQGIIDGIDYRLISCDYLDFKLHKIE